jgi:hypothetical protein
VPSTLCEHARTLPNPHDPVLLQARAAKLPDEFVEALTLAGPFAGVAAELTRLAHGGITRFIAAPVSADGRIESPLDALPGRGHATCAQRAGAISCWRHDSSERRKGK